MFNEQLSSNMMKAAVFFALFSSAETFVTPSRIVGQKQALTVAAEVDHFRGCRDVSCRLQLLYTSLELVPGEPFDVLRTSIQSTTSYVTVK